MTIQMKDSNLFEMSMGEMWSDVRKEWPRGNAGRIDEFRLVLDQTGSVERLDAVVLIPLQEGTALYDLEFNKKRSVMDVRRSIHENHHMEIDSDDVSPEAYFAYMNWIEKETIPGDSNYYTISSEPYVHKKYDIPNYDSYHVKEEGKTDVSDLYDPVTTVVTNVCGTKVSPDNPYFAEECQVSEKWLFDMRRDENGEWY
ncbi:hypothetical protein LCM20_06585 [Halobacillus litoralis]|uniref:hypothetical protein n=1 Tax=Halobacillus litoralis TaxID=45668 RepID=UPI001CD5B716|nr:hypothetical protein [Halobacillus litoralis]MCA0970248.1 hypothetical protein [Halobacillus litoralis]